MPSYQIVNKGHPSGGLSRLQLINIPMSSMCSAIFPTIDTVLPSLQASASSIVFPAMPTVPTPLSTAMPTLNIPSVEVAYAATGAQMGLLVSQIDAVIGVLTQFIPAVPIPAIPGLPGFSLSDLLAFNPSPLLSAMSAPGFNFSGIPGLPTLWPEIEAPEWKALSALQFAVAFYLPLLTDTILTLVKVFLDFLKKLGKSFPGLPSLSGAPGISLPSPLMPNMDIPNFETTYSMLSVKVNASGFVVKTLAEYVQKLPLISFPIPTMAIVFPEFC